MREHDSLPSPKEKENREVRSEGGKGQKNPAHFLSLSPFLPVSFLYVVIENRAR
jgi:hypothetical protein